MNCRFVRNELSAYLDRELDGKKMLAIRDHLSKCSECAVEFEELQKLKSLLCNCRTPLPPDDLSSRLTASILARQAADQSFPSMGDPTPRRLPALTFVGIALGSMAITFVFLSRVSEVSSNSAAGLPVAATDQKLTFDVQRDQIYSAGLDATNGVPVLIDGDGQPGESNPRVELKSSGSRKLAYDRTR